ncbi:unnamed protein product, partial [marine sediment metagenome]
GLKEQYYQEARAKGVLFIPYDVADKPKVEAVTENGKEIIRVNVNDQILGMNFSIDADVLASNSSKPGHRITAPAFTSTIWSVWVKSIAFASQNISQARHLPFLK